MNKYIHKSAISFQLPGLVHTFISTSPCLVIAAAQLGSIKIVLKNITHKNINSFQAPKSC